MGKEEINEGKLVDLEKDPNIHNITTLFKHYLRELPDPLLTTELASFWKTAADLSTEKKEIVLQGLLTKLPAEHLLAVREILKLFQAIIARQELNKMTSSNLAIIFGPVFIYDPNLDALAEALGSQAAIGIVQLLIDKADVFLEAIEKKKLLTLNPLRKKPTKLASLTYSKKLDSIKDRSSDSSADLESRKEVSPISRRAFSDGDTLRRSSSGPVEVPSSDSEE